MQKDQLYQNLKNRLKETTDLPPQKLGPATPVYKKAVSLVKTWPLKVIIPAAVGAGLIIQILLNGALVKIASILQYGF